MTDFTQAVARRAGISDDQAAEILTRHGVRETGVLPRPYRLLINRVAFSGEKAGTSSGAIDFSWELGPGLWCLCGDNLRGKSSVLEVIWSCLRGESDLQADVRKWIRHIQLDAQIDDEPFAVQIDTAGNELTGVLTVGRQRSTSSFTGDTEFQTTMSGFMMDRLGLEPLRGWRNDSAASSTGEDPDGQVTLTSWPAYSHALICRNQKDDVLLGETAAGGTMISLLQMFVGLPWTTTRRDIDAARNVLRQSLRGERRRAQQDTEARDRSVDELEQQIAKAKERIAQSDDASSLETSVADVERTSADLAELMDRQTDAAEQLRLIRQQEKELKETLVTDRGRLRDLRETLTAERFFGALRPTCCPRCSTPLEQLPHSNLDEAHCHICGSAPALTTADQSASDELEQSVHSLHDAYEQVRDAHQKAAAAFDAIASEIKTARTAMLEARAAVPKRDALRAHLEVARLEGALAERRAAQQRVQGTGQPTIDETVLDAARKEADSRATAATRQLLEAVSAEIYRLAVQLGMTELQEVDLRSNGTLSLVKGGSRTSFTPVTAGEKLRLRIATLLALLRVGQASGVGRHPGLILIDSPGAQETIAAALSEVLSQLQAICEETPHLQVITATANREVATSVIHQDRLRLASPGEAMW